jgi:short subunit dehydrogenase-like uncharacterized protein
LKQRLPDAIDLKIDIGGLNAVFTRHRNQWSIPNGARVRRDGRIITVSRPRETNCDFGEGPFSTLVLRWGDVSTAYYSTGIKNIEVRMAVTPPLRIAISLPGFARKIFGMPFVQSFLKAQIARMPEGPSDEVLRTGRRVLVGVVSNTNGENARARVTTGQGNVLTAQAGVEIARRVIVGEVKVGFQTPSLVYGSDLILQFEGATREELK